jgi:hypothetical protein
MVVEASRPDSVQELNKEILLKHQQFFIVIFMTSGKISVIYCPIWGTDQCKLPYVCIYLSEIDSETLQTSNSSYIQFHILKSVCHTLMHAKSYYSPNFAISDR